MSMAEPDHVPGVVAAAEVDSGCCFFSDSSLASGRSPYSPENIFQSLK
jgi:hypothetical protein